MSLHGQAGKASSEPGFCGRPGTATWMNAEEARWAVLVDRMQEGNKQQRGCVHLVAGGAAVGEPACSV